jgi:hypothetical protein
MDIMKITYSGVATTIPLYIENNILTCNTTDIAFTGDGAIDTVTKLKTELEKITGITATILNNSGTYDTTKINEISRTFPADVKTGAVYLSYDNYSSPKDVCETFNVPYSNIINSWFDNADTLITAQTGGFIFKEVTETVSIDTNIKNVRCNDKYSNYSFFANYYNELYLPQYAPIQSVSSLSIDGTSITTTTIVINYSSIILTSDSEVHHFPLGIGTVDLTFTYGYPKTSAYGIMAKQLATYLIFENLYSYVESGGNVKPFKVEHGGLVVTEEIGASTGVTNRMNIRMLFKGLPSKINMAVVK